MASRILATHRDLRAMVREGTFREDLYHRLAVFPIRLPPLRERREDIVPLARALVAELSAAAGRRPPRLDEALEKRLEEETWPGNVRELRNALERAMILADGDVLGVDHLWLEPSNDSTATPSDAVAPSTGAGTTSASEAPPVLAKGGSLADLEPQTIESTLREVGGNRRAAAAKLGIGLRTLYDKLKKYGLR